ncbi:MAG: GLPGLI family protein [Flavobacteriaceae bacterium]|nr:GLPGLI family protein [Flavobacteriaceae bacterium]
MKSINILFEIRPLLTVLSCFILSFTGSYAQTTLKVDYSVRKNDRYFEAMLVHNPELSVYTEFYSKIKDTVIFESNDRQSRTVNLKPLDDLHFIKDFNTGKIFHKGSVLSKKYFVTDSTDIFEWELTQDTLSVLGLKCQKANVSFRGRDYHAYFTTEIMISDGPWKFNGLPGLILKIVSLDEAYEFEAVGIDTRHDYVIADYENFINEIKKDRIPIIYTDYFKLKHQKLKELYQKQISELSTATSGAFRKYTEIEVIFEYPK